MNNIFKQIKKNQKGGTAILISVMIMVTILTVGMSLGNVVINNLRSSANQANATQAYFAAEAAAENFLWEVRQDGFDPPFEGCVDDSYVVQTFDGCSSSPDKSILDNEALFYIHYATSTATTTITNYGEFKDTRRAVRLSY